MNESSKGVQETNKESVSSARPATGLEFFNRLPWERMVTWAFVFFILYLLREFFLVVFATFVICYFVQRLTTMLLNRIPKARHSVSAVRAATFLSFILLSALFVGLLLAIFPELLKQAQAVLRRAEHTDLKSESQELIDRTLGSYLFSRTYTSPEAINAAVQQHRTSDKFGDGWWQAWPAVQADVTSHEHKLQSSNVHRNTVQGLSAASDLEVAFNNYVQENANIGIDFATFAKWNAAFSDGQTAFVEAVRQTVGSAGSSNATQLATKDFEYQTRSDLADKWMQSDPIAEGLRHYLTAHQPEYLNELALWSQGLIVAALLLPLHLGLALLVSLLICLDAPNIMDRVRSIRDSRVRGFYDEIAPMLVKFGWLTGKALEAQLVVGVFNTLLSVVALLVLGVDSIYFLSAVVFLSSIVPVIGAMFACTVVFLMSTLQPDGSLVLALQALLSVAAIHTITSFVIAPRIYGTSFHLHPVVVLVILIVAEHYFGMWGLVLGVPLAVYVFQIALYGNTIADSNSTTIDPFSNSNERLTVESK